MQIVATQQPSSGQANIPPIPPPDPTQPLFLRGYEIGYVHGTEHGLDIAEQQYRATWPVSAAIARQIAETVAYADIAERRSEPDRAGIQRSILEARHIVPAKTPQPTERWLTDAMVQACLDSWTPITAAVTA